MWEVINSLFGRGTERSGVIQPTAIESRVTPPEPPYPNTITGVLDRLRKVLLVDETATPQELQRAYIEMLSIYQEGVDNFEALARRNNRSWEGRIPGHANWFEQDGGFYSFKESADIRRKTIIIQEMSTKSTYFDSSESHETIRVIGSRDKKDLYFVEHKLQEVGLGPNSSKILITQDRIGFKGGGYPVIFSTIHNPDHRSYPPQLPLRSKLRLRLDTPY